MEATQNLVKLTGMRWPIQRGAVPATRDKGGSPRVLSGAVHSFMNQTPEVSLLRLYLIRALFLIMCLGTVFTQVPGMLHRDPPWSLMHGVGAAMLLAMALLSAIGVRYPLQMLPILMWELLWKSIWLLVFAMPLWRAGTIDAETVQSAKECLMGVVLVPLVMPWRYVWRHYVKQAGDRWRGVGARR